jgi:tRNA threonylcarbamoyl adenosine modification protein (Sua5/YciO/YrdC/YwlC family)
MTRILDLRSNDDPRDAIHWAVQALVEGKVVAIATDTVYGLAASALSPGAVETILDLKGRDGADPMAISVSSREAASDFFCEVSPLARRLAARCFPGPLTLVVPCRSSRSAIIQIPPSVRQKITGPGDCVGFRVVDHRVLYHIHRLVSAPLVLTSANRSGDEAPTTAGGVLKSLGVAANDPRLALVLDDGPTRFGRPSTVVRVDNDGMEILRSGAIEEAAMEQFAKPLIALVCTGNTCRSPMAETLLRDQLFKRFGCEDAARVVSAGLAASAGMSASPQAIEVMGRKSLDLTSHTSRPLDDSIIASADLILTMTQRHREAILTAFPTLSDRVFTLRQNGGDISDPVGCPVDVYQACADQIETELSRWMDRHIAALIPHPSHSSRTATRNSDDTTPGGQS